MTPSTDATAHALHALAHEHLPADIAERWIGLLRPSAGLRAAGGAESVVGRLGGLPQLPEGVQWPVWERHGALTFIGSVDCAALPGAALDIPLPADGTLAFFYFDGQLDDGRALVRPNDAATWAGARVLYVPAGVPVTERAAPAGIRPYREVPLTAHVETTAPYEWHPVVYREFDPMDDDHPLWGEDFREDLYERVDVSKHRIGGHASPDQDDVETEVAHGALGSPPRNDPRLEDEALRWVLLAQFGSDDDAGMMWGDLGTLYWLIRPEDLAARRFDRAMFTWQCG